jgi:hypothetical protein
MLGGALRGMDVAWLLRKTLTSCVASWFATSAAARVAGTSPSTAPAIPDIRHRSGQRTTNDPSGGHSQPRS